MMDAALGENERYAGEMTRCNALLGSLRPGCGGAAARRPGR